MLFNQNGNSRDKNESEKRLGKLVVTGGNTTKVLEFVEETLHQMALFVNPPIAIPRVGVVHFWRYAIIAAAHQNIFPDFLGAISLIAKHNALHDFNMVKHIGGNFGIVYVPG